VDFWFAVLDNMVPNHEGEARIPDMIRVSEFLAERGWGKAPQPLEHGAGEGVAPVSITIDLGGKR
jgi:hypothetical protein